MNQLRRTIRMILLEDACASISNTNITQGIAELERLGLKITSFYSPQEYDSGAPRHIGLHIYDDLGGDKAHWLGSYQVTGENCLGAYQCTNTDSRNLRGTGIGALLYDVACELSGGHGLSSDRNEVSPSAWKMWKYMWKNNKVYRKAGTYDWDGEQTPSDPGDDCDGTSWKDHNHGWRPHEHPLNQVYVKIDTTRPTTNCLIEKGLIEFEED